MAKNIEMQQLNSDGNYEVVYPQTLGSNIILGKEVEDIFSTNNLNNALLVINENIEKAYVRAVSTYDVNCNENSGEIINLTTNSGAFCRSGVYSATTNFEFDLSSIPDNKRIVYMSVTTANINSNSLGKPYGAYTFYGVLTINEEEIGEITTNVRSGEFGPINFSLLYGRALTNKDKLIFKYSHSNTSDNGYQSQTGSYSGNFNLMING